MFYCPTCEEKLRADATTCRNCGEILVGGDSQQFRMLKAAMRPYAEYGYEVESLTESSATMVLPKIFSVWSLLLLCVWPLFIVYLVAYLAQKEKRAFFHFGEDGNVQVSGHTLKSELKGDVIFPTARWRGKKWAFIRRKS